MLSPRYFLTVLLIAQTSAARQNESLARAIHDAFLANISAFQYGRVTFEYVKGEARNAAAARAGMFDPKHALIGMYAFHGPEARLDHVFPEEDMRRTTKYIGDDTRMETLVSFRAATSGKVSVSETFSVGRNKEQGWSRGIKMRAGPQWFLEFYEFPNSLGRVDGTRVDNLGLRLREALKGNPEYKIDEIDSRAELEGRSVAKLSISGPFGREDYWVDLQCGAIPLKMSVYYRDKETLRLAREIYNDDIRRIPDRGWLPFHQYWHYVSNEAGHYVIKEADFKNPPPRSALGLDFPEPVGLRNENTGVSYPPRKFWDLAALPPLGSPGVEKTAVSTIPMDQVPAHPKEREAPRRYDVLLLGLVGLVSLVAWWAWISRAGHG